jgi:hypothetical protein
MSIHYIIHLTMFVTVRISCFRTSGNNRQNGSSLQNIAGGNSIIGCGRGSWEDHTGFFLYWAIRFFGGTNYHFQVHYLTIENFYFLCLCSCSFQNKSIHTIKFSTNTSSITEIQGLYTSNKKRGQVWRAVIDFVAANNTDVVW